MSFLDLPPLHRAAGLIRLPGSKSISNRTLLLAALAAGDTEIHDLLDSDDTRVMLASLRQLGIDIAPIGPDSYRVKGAGGVFPVKEASLFLGNAGTAFRPLTAALALAGGRYTLSGVPRMHERPIGDLVDGLRQIGAAVDYLENPGYPPLTLQPAAIRLDRPIRVRGDVSSQFLTALLMALPLSGQAAVIEMSTELISKPYIEITLNLMARFGVKVERQGWERFSISAGQRYRSPGTIHVEGDASSASYFLAAGAIGGGPVRVEGVGRDSIQGDVAFAAALEAMGARIEMGANWMEARSPAHGKLKAFDLDLNHIPDAAMTLAVAALFADGPCTLRNIASWRVKETDRIAAMAAELRKVGATVEEDADFIRVVPPASLTPSASIATYDDHRMAMCLSLAALGGVPVRILEPECVAKTFPDYFERYAEVTAPVIAIDGPSASGKGTVAARVATTLGYHMLDSGALYRLTALAARKAGVAWEDEAAVAAIAAALPAEFEGERILLSGEEVSEAIRSEEMGDGASKVAALPAVRAALLARQRAYRRWPGLVADGRDMGSVVFPWAECKVFLTASAEARAERRHKQLIAKGVPAKITPLLQDLRERDARDTARSVAPLQKCAEAELLDTSNLSIEQAVAAVLGCARERIH
ncbi:bifunctional 3-phosphoshikimate 1-carboxyvinyltransferase/cytidylate kinase [Denitratisoma oestradiolicum]|uniref:Multifunctional fusion protein n=1 Tax=Denitratisoma oestradiolicum TaxID=311182 RepID=A0A6S6YQZ7_9PROT|nr:bifunctional 3-phosphoshikimate 1-carboxyvinyltransferase/cytidylate kinase [Denitratisoma oestradiolicum]TWO80389.1 cytidylate kinase [Denitratisoma oestradiolicum]CAB1370192.1 3-phosphoshikimate 1-carboxyvinyltransferase / Cytidylate kinase [Denitratisoma oestradiolicum]